MSYTKQITNKQMETYTFVQRRTYTIHVLNIYVRELYNIK